MGHALDARAAARGIEVGVENAARRAELELEADALADLERGIAEVRDEFGRGQAEDAAADPRLRGGGDGRRRRRGRRHLGARGAGGEEQGEERG